MGGEWGLFWKQCSAACQWGLYIGVISFLFMNVFGPLLVLLYMHEYMPHIGAYDVAVLCFLEFLAVLLLFNGAPV